MGDGVTSRGAIHASRHVVGQGGTAGICAGSRPGEREPVPTYGPQWGLIEMVRNSTTNLNSMAFDDFVCYFIMFSISQTMSDLMHVGYGFKRSSQANLQKS